jgi:hypothetical protein
MSKALRTVVLLVMATLAIGGVLGLSGCSSSSSAPPAVVNVKDATPTTLGSVNLPVAARNEPVNSRVPTWPWE